MRVKPAMTEKAEKFCHPGLDPGSMLAALKNLRVLIIPKRVFFFYQRHLPVTLAVFKLFFTMDGRFNGFCTFKADQMMHVAARGEPIAQLALVFMRAPHKMVGYADIKRSLGFADQHVEKMRHGGLTSSVRLLRLLAVHLN